MESILTDYSYCRGLIHQAHRINGINIDRWQGFE